MAEKRAAAEMTEAEVIAIFREADAILEGHFILTSGLRSPLFLQKARVFMYPDKTERLCRALAAKVRAAADLGPIDFVVAPAVGGIVPGYETARQLGVRAMWVEREEGAFRLRRFEMPKGARVLDRRGYRHYRPLDPRDRRGASQSWAPRSSPAPA